jgi:hypothetical protein
MWRTWYYSPSTVTSKYRKHPDPGRKKTSMHRYRSPPEGWWLLWSLDVFHRGLRRSSLIKNKRIFVKKKPCSRSICGFSPDWIWTQWIGMRYGSGKLIRIPYRKVQRAIIWVESETNRQFLL